MSLPQYEIENNKLITLKLWSLIVKHNGVEKFCTYYKNNGATYADEMRVIQTEKDGLALEIKYGEKIEIAPFYHSRVKAAMVHFMERGVARVVWGDPPVLTLDLNQESEETSSNYHIACALWTFIAWYKGSPLLFEFMFPGAESVHSYAPNNKLAFGVWYKDAKAIQSYSFFAASLHKTMEHFIDNSLVTIEWL